MRILRSAPPAASGFVDRLRHHCWEALAALALGWFLLAAGMALAKLNRLIRLQQIVDPCPLRGSVRR